MVPPPLQSLIAGTIVQRTVTGAVAWVRRRKGAASMPGREPGGHGTDEAELTIVVGRFDRAAMIRFPRDHFDHEPRTQAGLGQL